MINYFFSLSLQVSSQARRTSSGKKRSYGKILSPWYILFCIIISSRVETCLGMSGKVYVAIEGFARRDCMKGKPGRGFALDCGDVAKRMTSLFF